MIQIKHIIFVKANIVQLFFNPNPIKAIKLITKIIVQTVSPIRNS